MLAYGVMTALVARERFGVGQEVNASHLGSMSFLQGLSLSMKLMAGAAMPRSLRSEAGNPLWNHYRCGDDQWIALAMLQPDRYWADFCRVIERPELAEDPRFVDMTARAMNRVECVALIDEAFARHSRDEWMRRLKEAGGGTSCAPGSRFSSTYRGGGALCRSLVQGDKSRSLYKKRCRPLFVLPTPLSRTHAAMQSW